MAEKDRRRGASLGFVVGFGVGIPATVFALSNLEATRVEFLGWQAEVPLWAVMAISLVAGVVLGIAGLLAWQARRRRGRRKATASTAVESGDAVPLDTSDGGRELPGSSTHDDSQPPPAAPDPGDALDR